MIELSAAAREALEQGSIMRAVKCVREEHGCSLAEAKHAVDSYLDRNPLVARQVRKPLPRGCLALLGVIVIGALVLVVEILRGVFDR